MSVLRSVSLIILAGPLCAALPRLSALTGSGQKTIDASRRVTQAPAADFETLKAKADAAREADQIAEAVTLYEQLVKIRPGWAEGWWYVGTLHYDSDQYAPAAAAFSRYVTLERGNGQGWAMLGLCEFRMAQFASSREHLVKARSLGLGGNEELARVVRYHQAVLLTRARQFEMAQALLNGFAVEHRESAAVLDALGLAVLRIPASLESLSAEKREMVRQFGKAAFLAGERRVPEARALYDAAEARYRDQPNVAYAYGVWLMMQKEPEHAMSFFRKELRREPAHVPAMLQIAFHAIDSGNFEEAKAHALKAAELEPENFTAHYALGRIYLESNAIPQAVTELEKSARLAPDAASVQFVLAKAYARANRPADAARARAEFRRLDAIDKKRRGEATGEESASGRPVP